MLSKGENAQYHRQLILSEIGESGQAKLKNAKVLVIGAGGLGSAILPYLIAAGTGNTGIIDHDKVEVSNLHRQVLFSTDDIGQNKAVIAAEKLKKLNPHIQITAYPEALTRENALELFSSYDIIVDGSDNFPTRYLVNDAAVMCNKPVVFGSIYKFEGQVSVFNYQDGPTYRCLFPTPPPPGASPNCAEIGVLGVLPGIIGAMQANEVIKMVCGIGQVLSGKLLTIDCLTMQTQTLKFSKNVQEIPDALNDVEYACIRDEGVMDEITSEDFINSDLKNTTVVDVRTSSERESSRMDMLPPDSPDLHIPLDQLESLCDTIPTHQTIVFYCQSGVRSRQAAQWFLREYPAAKVLSLRGGLATLLNSVS